MRCERELYRRMPSPYGRRPALGGPHACSRAYIGARAPFHAQLLAANTLRQEARDGADVMPFLAVPVLRNRLFYCGVNNIQSPEL
eukprot:6194065-Pleurochrysis_carterae.AAC.1